MWKEIGEEVLCGFTKPWFYDGPCIQGSKCSECERFFDDEGNRK